MVDEEAVGLMGTPGGGAKIIHGDGALEHKLQERKVSEFKTQFSTPTFLSTQSFLLTSLSVFHYLPQFGMLLVLNFSFIIMPSPFLKCHLGALPGVLNHFLIKLFLAGRGGGVARGEMQGEPEPCSRTLSM